MEATKPLFKLMADYLETKDLQGYEHRSNVAPSLRDLIIFLIVPIVGPVGTGTMGLIKKFYLRELLDFVSFRIQIMSSTLPSFDMETWQKLLEEIPVVESKIGYTFKEKELLALAFVHRSFVNENKENIAKHNERLEFFGDSILGLLISEYLFKYLPSTPEGDLSRYRSRLVEACSCMLYVKKLDLWPYVLMGKGERQNDGRGRDSILANLFEAILAAIYLDGGIENAKRFLFKNFSEEINQILKTPIRNWKAQLQNYTQHKFHQPPVYKTLSEEGPDHGKTFYISVHVNGQECGRGTGASKKEAQQAAAQSAITHFGDVAEEE